MKRFILILLPLLLTVGGQSGRADPPPAPPIAPPVVIPPVPVAPSVVPPVAPTPSDPPEPSFPQIVLETPAGDELPATAHVGDLYVVSGSKSVNVRQLTFSIYPPVSRDYDKRTRKLIFSVAQDGEYKITVTATSPDGGLATDVRTVTFGDASSALPANASMPRQTNYVQFVLAEARKMTHANRKGDLAALASIFSTQGGLAATGGVANRETLFQYTDNQIERTLGPDLADCTPFIKSLLAKTSTEGGDLGRLGAVWQEIAEGCRRASR